MAFSQKLGLEANRPPLANDLSKERQRELRSRSAEILTSVPRGHYQIYGTSRRRTLCAYSVYPGRFSRRYFSSCKSRQANQAIKNGVVRRLHHEASARGAPTHTRRAPAYIGCRTIA